MGASDERFAPGEAVYLMTELRGDRRIHEIGTRARVLSDHGAVIVLHLDGSEAEVVTCPRGHVAHAVDRPVRQPVPATSRGWLRPTTA